MSECDWQASVRDFFLIYYINSLLIILFKWKFNLVKMNFE